MMDDSHALVSSMVNHYEMEISPVSKKHMY